MGWLERVNKLQSGESVTFRPKGQSMKGRIDSGQKVTVEPLKSPPKKGDIVVAKVKGTYYLHLVSAIKGHQFQISNNRGRVNGWTSLNQIYGICTKIED